MVDGSPVRLGQHRRKFPLPPRKRSIEVMKELKAQQEAKCYEKGLTGGATQDKNEKFCLPLQMQTAEENCPAEGAYPRKGIDRMINRRATEGATPQIVLPPDSPPSQQPSVQRESTHQSLPSRLTSSINGGDMVDRSPLRLGRKPPKLSPPIHQTTSEPSS